MSNAVPVCTHTKTDGVRCGSPAVAGTNLCYHHSAVKTALGKPNGKVGNGGFAPIPFVFPEDRASMQINFFLLLQAYNEQRIDQRTYNAFLGLLRSMARNLGKMGSLVEEPRDQESEGRGETEKRSSRKENPEEDPNAIPPGYADEVQRRLDRELEERLARQQQASGGSLNGSGNSH